MHADTLAKGAHGHLGTELEHAHTDDEQHRAEEEHGGGGNIERDKECGNKKNDQGNGQYGHDRFLDLRPQFTVHSRTSFRFFRSFKAFLIHYTIFPGVCL